MSNAPISEPRTFRWKGTLVLVAISLIVMVAARGVILQYRGSVAAAKESVLKTDLFRMRDAIHQYFQQKGRYPNSLDALVAEGYLRRIPQDPITRSTATWTTRLADRDLVNPSPRGVYDVKSGAHGTARDGSKYSDW